MFWKLCGKDAAEWNAGIPAGTAFEKRSKPSLFDNF